MTDSKTHATESVAASGAEPALGWTRRRVADELGVSVTTVRRLEKSRVLTPSSSDDRQTRLHDPDQVRALQQERQRTGAGFNDERPPRSRTRSDGEIPYAQIFELLDDGFDAVAIVRETGVLPEHVRHALEWYYDLQNDDLVALSALERLTNAEQHVVDLTRTVAGLVAQTYRRCTCPNCGAASVPIIPARYVCCGALAEVPGLHPPG